MHGFHFAITLKELSAAGKRSLIVLQGQRVDMTSVGYRGYRDHITRKPAGRPLAELEASDLQI